MQKEEFDNIKLNIQAELLRIQELIEGSSVKNLHQIQRVYNGLQTVRNVFEETNVSE